jgi:hypothetical protein
LVRRIVAGRVKQQQVIGNDLWILKNESAWAADVLIDAGCLVQAIMPDHVRAMVVPTAKRAVPWLGSRRHPKILFPYGTCGGCTWNQNYGYGRINVAAALAAAGSPGSTTVAFSVGAGGDDGNVGASSAPLYPPSVAAVGSSSGSVFTAGRRFVFGGYDVYTGLVRFDTSSLPDDATVTGATLRLFVTRTADADGRNFVGEWYDAASWPIDGGDYALSSTGSALSGADVTLIRAGASNDFALSGLGSVSKTGLTGLRLHVDGGQPTGDNVVQVASSENSSYPKPQLIITYTR